jgi:hypothetical protein
MALPKMLFRKSAEDGLMAHAAGFAAGAGGRVLERAGMATAGARVAALCAARRAVDVAAGVLDEHIARQRIRRFSVGHGTSLT